MSLLKKTIFVCVDCETTGLDTKNDKIIEVGAVRFTLEKVLDRFETLIDPRCPIPAASQAIHHITDEMVAGKPSIDEKAQEIIAFLKEGYLIGHGILFDIQMLTNAGIPLSDRPYIDTLRLARLYGQSPVNSLEGLRKHFHIPAESAHRALDDAYINSEVFKYLVKPYKTLSQLERALDKPIRMRHMPLGKHKGRPFREVPIQYLRWAVHQDFDRDLLFSIKSELKRRKSGQGPSHNPFANL